MSRLALLAISALVSACATPVSLTGRSEADLRAALGNPAAVYPLDGGARALAFPMGPMGTVTYMAEVGPEGSVRSVRQALTEEVFNQVNPGLTRDAVLRLIGPPSDSMEFSRLGQVSWEYHFQDTWGYRAHFFVNFDRQGIVVGKFTRRIMIDQASDR